MIETQTTCLFDEMLDASTAVDYSNVYDATSYATLIFAVANEAGLLLPNGNKQAYEAIQTIRLAKEWVYNVKTNIGKMEAGHAMDMLAPYDLMHRLAHHSPTPKTFSDKYLLKAFEARIHGDKSVNIISIVLSRRSLIGEINHILGAHLNGMHPVLTAGSRNSETDEPLRIYQITTLSKSSAF